MEHIVGRLIFMGYTNLRTGRRRSPVVSAAGRMKLGEKRPRAEKGVQPDKRRHASLLTAALSTCLVSIAIISCILGGASASARLDGDLPAGDSVDIRGIVDKAQSSRSTPRDEWRKGSMPYLYQTDAQWGGEPYAEDTIAGSGCGPTCIAMAWVYLTGRTDLDPASMAAFSELNGFVDSGMTSWALMTQGARMLGLESEVLHNDRAEIVEALHSGRPVIVSVAEGDFTTNGHFIVLFRMDENNQVEIRDPNSMERSKRRWDLDRIMDQARNYWALSLP